MSALSASKLPDGVRLRGACKSRVLQVSLCNGALFSSRDKKGKGGKNPFTRNSFRRLASSLLLRLSTHGQSLGVR